MAGAMWLTLAVSLALALGTGTAGAAAPSVTSTGGNVVITGGDVSFALDTVTTSVSQLVSGIAEAKANAQLAETVAGVSTLTAAVSAQASSLDKMQSAQSTLISNVIGNAAAGTNLGSLKATVDSLVSMNNTLVGDVSALKATTASASDLSSIQVSQSSLETRVNMSEQCAVMGMAYNSNTGQCVTSPTVLADAGSAAAKCASAADHGKTVFDSGSDRLAVCQAKRGIPSWVSVPLSGDSLTQDMVFPQTTSFNYVAVDNIPNMTEVSFAFWMKADNLTGAPNVEHYPISYANSVSQNQFFFGTVPQNIGFPTSGSTLTYRAPPIHTGEWHHWSICWRPSTGFVQIYLDGGRMWSNTTSYRVNVVRGGGILVLGQEQDSVGGGFQASQTFFGRLNNFNVYTRFLTQDEVLQSMCGVLPEGDAVSWEQITHSYFGSGISLQPSDRPATSLACPNDFDIQFGTLSNTSYVASTLPQNLNDFTLVFWVRAYRNYQTDTSYVFSYAVDGKDNMLLVRSSPDFGIFINQAERTVSASPSHDGKWHHFAITRRFDTGNVTVYRDGGRLATFILQTAVPIPSGGVIVLGHEQDNGPSWLDTNQRFAGRLGDVNVYSKAFTQEEVQQAMCNAWPGDAVRWSDFRVNLTGTEVQVVPRMRKMAGDTCQGSVDLVFNQGDINHYALFNASQQQGAPALSAFTVVMWVYSDNKRGQDQYAFSFGNSQSQNAVLIRTTPAVFVDVLYDLTGRVRSNVNFDLHDGKWHHVAVTWRNSDGQTVVYVDNVQMSSQNGVKGTTFRWDGQLVLGQEQDENFTLDTAQRFNGRLTQVNMYSRVLTSAELNQAYCGQAPDPSSMVVRWEDLQANIVGTDVAVAPTTLTQSCSP